MPMHLEDCGSCQAWPALGGQANKQLIEPEGGPCPFVFLPLGPWEGGAHTGPDLPVRVPSWASWGVGGASSHPLLSATVPTALPLSLVRARPAVLAAGGVTQQVHGLGSPTCADLLSGGCWGKLLWKTHPVLPLVAVTSFKVAAEGPVPLICTLFCWMAASSTGGASSPSFSDTRASAPLKESTPPQLSLSSPGGVVSVPWSRHGHTVWAWPIHPSALSEQFRVDKESQSIK